eukprot:Gb_23148 [translate_table: standard]
MPNIAWKQRKAAPKQRKFAQNLSLERKDRVLY